MAVITDTLEGIIDKTLWYHYDLANDVLYLRYANDRDSATYVEEGEDGFLRLRREKDDAVVGMTVVNWWKSQQEGSLPDSLREVEKRIEPWKD
jgi:hypothetical protein